MKRTVPSVSISSPTPFVAAPYGHAVIPVLLANRADKPVNIDPQADTPNTDIVVVWPKQLAPRSWEVVMALVRLHDNMTQAQITLRAGGSDAVITVVRALDLSQTVWRRRFASQLSASDAHPAAADIDDSSWDPVRTGAIWERQEDAWCRVTCTIPSAWRNYPVRVVMGAIDDNDETFFNGVAIGQTTGWDQWRDYRIPPDLVRWDQRNVLTVRVQNVNAGGGLSREPFLIACGDSVSTAAPATASAERRPAAGPVGPALPFRPMRVVDGVLRYPDGREVALWGANTYPMSWHQYRNMKRLGVDFHKIIDTDLDHMQRMGVEIVRIHVFDREITQRDGSIVDNQHLELLDYVSAGCARRGIYLYLTPIAWWPSPQQRPDAFSGQFSKPGCMFVPEARQAAARYLTQFLTRRNRYTGRPYWQEPHLCLLEVMNEPTYFVYGDLTDTVYDFRVQGDTEANVNRDLQVLRDEWNDWLQRHTLSGSQAHFSLFRYEQMRRYIREMVGAIRATGATQPVAISYFGVNGPDITQAIADSECDAITISAYPAGWSRVNDGENLLRFAESLQLPHVLAHKARLAYEFDNCASNTGGYMYPALAAHFRSAGVQVACQFQYDSIATARWNLDWDNHWLNLYYTPVKAAAFTAGGAAFRAIPRDIQYPAPKDELKVGPMAASFTRNNSLTVIGEAVYHARSLDDWRPISLPAHPRLVTGTGTSPWVECHGGGVYRLERIRPDAYRFQLNPYADLIGNSLRGRPEHEVARLRWRPTPVRFPWLRGRWELRPQGSERKPIRLTPTSWLCEPGAYTLTRS